MPAQGHDPPAPSTTVVAAIIGRDGRFLVCRRPDAGAAPGRWEFPGGKVRAGESAAAALARELGEELGIAARVGPLLGEHRLESGAEGAICLRFHAVEITAGEPRRLHHAELRWATPAELDALDLLPGDRWVLARLGGR